MMREREILREWAKSERLKNLQKMQQREAERNLRGSVFRVARMLVLHNLIESLFGRKK
jgi:hypothetical protein